MTLPLKTVNPEDQAATFDDSESPTAKSYDSASGRLGDAEHATLPPEWGRAQRVRHATDVYLSELKELDYDVLPNKLDASSDLLARTTRACIAKWVGDMGKKRPLYVPGGVPSSLTAWQYAKLAARWHHIRRIAHAGLADTSLDEVRVYQPVGAHEGLWLSDDSAVRALVFEFDQDIPDHKMKEVLGKLYDSVDRVEKTSNRDLIPCKSRVFDFTTKTQRSYDPEIDVFTSKLAVDCPLTKPNEPLRLLSDGTPWTFSDWLADLFEPLKDRDEVAETVWEVISAAMRPGVRWNRAAFFHSTRGESGKGTLVEMIQNLFGEGSSAYCSIPLDQWGGPGNDFKLEPLLTALAVLVDENQVGEHLAFMAAFKAAVTGDRLAINRKNLRVLTIRFQGFIIQCVNALPSTKDKSGSFSRRQLFVPFPKSFTGSAFPEIKEGFLRDPDVLEFVLWRALHMTHYTLSEPKSCRALKEEAKTRNDLVHEFFAEVRKYFVWDLLPFSFLHRLFDAWRLRENPGSKPLSKQTFIDRLLEAVSHDDLWSCEDRTKVIKRALRMEGDEPMLHEFGVPVDAWNSKATTYKGLVRRTDLPGNVAELEKLRAQDIAEWETQAIDDDGVEDHGHVPEHAAIARMGSTCICRVSSGGATRRQLARTAAVKRSMAIDAALINARIDAGVVAAAPGSIAA